MEIDGSFSPDTVALMRLQAEKLVSDVLSRSKDLKKYLLPALRVAVLTNRLTEKNTMLQQLEMELFAPNSKSGSLGETSQKNAKFDLESASILSPQEVISKLRTLK